MTCLKLCSWGPPYCWVPVSRLFKQSFFCKNNPEHIYARYALGKGVDLELDFGGGGLNCLFHVKVS